MVTRATAAEWPAEVADDDVVLEVDGVSKKFCRQLKRSLYYGVRDIAADLLAQRRRGDTLRPGEFWALERVSFRMVRGEALGLIGPNGAGKTTLLRIISGVIKPDAGRVRVRGALAPLIALGAGFSPVLTGRENIYANMSILGLTTPQIEDRLEDVIAFAEIADAIDAPVATYSSGMAARLGFACAIHADPDILLIDEVLAVGDIQFRAKCTRRLAELREHGTSFLIVNHKPAAILSLCERAVYLRHDRTVTVGPSDTVVKQYEEDLMLRGVVPSTGVYTVPTSPARESTDVNIQYVCFRGPDGAVLESPRTGSPVTLCVGCRVARPQRDVYLKCKITDLARENDAVLDLNGDYDGERFGVPSGDAELRIHMPTLGLRPGIYAMDIYVVRKPQYCFDIVQGVRFRVTHGERSRDLMGRNLYHQARHWSVHVMQTTSSGAGT